MQERLSPRYPSDLDVDRKPRETASHAKPGMLRRVRLIHILASIALIGAVLIIADILRRESGGGPTIDFRSQEGTVSEWMRTGFVKSIDDSSGTVLVSEEAWAKISRDKKMGIALLLRDYFSNKNRNNHGKLIVKGDVSNEVLVRIALPTNQ